MTGRSHIFLSNHFCWSTRPVRGETKDVLCRVKHPVFQSTRPVRGETRHVPETDVGSRISIHSPRAGRDLRGSCAQRIISSFQSTRPVRGETACHLDIRLQRGISIHSPRAGRDSAVIRGALHRIYFNPLAPCGARLRSVLEFLATMIFQSTRPVRGETSARPEPHTADTISIHSPRAGRDSMACQSRFQLRVFQSTRPVRGETKRIFRVPNRH